MHIATIEGITEKLVALSPNQLAIVDDFVIALVRRSRTNGDQNRQLEERPIATIEELRLDFWPAEEDIDDFLKAREVWRAQDIQLEQGRAL